MNNKHNELLALLNPLIDFMCENDYHYFIVAGKDETATRHMRTKDGEVESMIAGLISKNADVKTVFERVFKITKIKK